MREIIIASANRASALKLKGALQEARIFVNNIFSSGSEVLSYSSIHPDALAVCGKLRDMSVVHLAELLPADFDLIALLPSGEAQGVYYSNLVCLNKPVSFPELLDTVRLLGATARECALPVKETSAERTELLKKAKKIIMSRHHISEREAHSFLQHRSMETGLKIEEIAKIITEAKNEIY